MSYCFSDTYVLYKLEQVQAEIGVFDLLDWSKLIAGYHLNPKMVEHKGYIGMELEEKNRLVLERKERLKTMPEIKQSKPVNMRPYAYMRKFPKSVTIYSFAEVVDELQIADDSILRRILKDYEPNVAMTEYRGQQGFDEAAKDIILAELEERRKVIAKQDHMRELERMARLMDFVQA